ncbi:AI-2E family transporter [Mycobacterium seoulense]|uniref:AI-2E family transporter n=1 Tax=Mycobacterium seoulense TaxID=386911 RepID=A0A7I7P036_9MYCO|nr:AI-2E family transporter [Mycobacterium seoulense]MCV7437242.1 AI-2E family transporter [Mycobacterium seoulense]BBY02246.1 AI-2E family transporter [Mycobacterium seoulense]
MGQPHREDEGAIVEAEQRAARLRSAGHRFGRRGQRFDRRSPFVMGLTASAGVAVTYAAVRVLGSMSSVLVLIGVAMFFALGLETAVSWLVNHKLPRWAAVTVVVAAVFALIAGTVAATIPPLVQEARQLVEQLPHYLQHAHDRSSLIGRLDERIHLQQRITEMVSGSGRFTFAGILRTGSEVFGVLSHVGVVAMLTIYFIADMRRIRAGFYRLMPNSRRPRAILIGDEVVAKFGAYLFGNVLTSVIAGFATFVWCVLLDVPYAVLLGVVVAVLDLFPYGSTVGGFIVAAVALSVSIPVAIATVAFYMGFRLGEDYLLTPRIVGRAVRVPAGVTVVAVLLGAAWLGVVGALVAIPLAAALQLLAQELLFPALDEA